MSDKAIAGLAHFTATEPLDAATIDAITHLAWGRPGWVVELVRIAQAGHIVTRPVPRITGLAPGQDRIDSIWPTLLRDGADPLSPQQMAAAVALAEIGGRTLTGARLLIGAGTVSALLAKRVLVPDPHNPRLRGVPPVFAAAIRTILPEHILDSTCATVAVKLATLHDSGITLTAREMYFSAQAVGSAEPEAPHRTGFRNLTGKVAEDYIEFGLVDDARDLILHAASINDAEAPDAGVSTADDQIGALRTAAALHGPVAATRFLESVLPDGAESDASAQAEIGMAYLMSLIHAEVVGLRPATSPSRFERKDSGSKTPPGAEGADAPASVSATLCQAATVFDAWNTLTPIDGIANELLTVQATHPVAEVVLACAYLLDLECLISGRLPHDAAPMADRAAWLSTVALSSPPELRDLVSLCAVAEGLVTVLTGDYANAHDTLLATVENLPGAAFHRNWTLHLVASAQALASGSIKRATSEWELFSRTLPRFLPLRLRSLIDELHDHLSAQVHDNAQPTASSRLPYKLVAYAGGSFDALSPREAPPTKLETACRAQSVPMVVLVREHLEAAATQNTSRLLPVAETLVSHELWGPAAHALRQARSIFVGRGATRSVTACDERLAELAELARVQNPWFALEAVESTPIVHLTPRQLRAARLAAQGLSNKEIAQQMGCQVRTAESHVAQARAKLGAARRSDLADRIAALVDRA